MHIWQVSARAKYSLLKHMQSTQMHFKLGYDENSLYICLNMPKDCQKICLVFILTVNSNQNPGQLT